MINGNNNPVQIKVQNLIRNFEKCLDINIRHGPFNLGHEMTYHRRTIKLRESYDSSINALEDNDFIESLHGTLGKWGMARYATLMPLPEFSEKLRKCAKDISVFDGKRIDDPNLDIGLISRDLWQLMVSLEINPQKTRIVLCSKTLHHILPDLVVPIDRGYTGPFFERYESAFKPGEREARLFEEVMGYFAVIARATNPAQYIKANGWNTCRTKIIDNAIIGYQCAPFYGKSLE